MKNVLVFKTTVTNKTEVQKLSPLLDKLIENNCIWNFDLEDCDKILRVETLKEQPLNFSGLLRLHGFNCEEL